MMLDKFKRVSTSISFLISFLTLNALFAQYTSAANSDLNFPFRKQDGFEPISDSLLVKSIKKHIEQREYIEAIKLMSQVLDSKHQNTEIISHLIDETHTNLTPLRSQILEHSFFESLSLSKDELINVRNISFQMIELLNLMEAQNTSKPLIKKDFLYLSFVACFHLDDFKSALHYADLFLQASNYPNDFDQQAEKAMLYQAASLFKQGEHQQSFYKLDTILRFNARSHTALLMSSNFHFDLGNYDYSIDFYRKVTNFYPNLKSSYTGLADLYDRIARKKRSLLPIEPKLDSTKIISEIQKREAQKIISQFKKNKEDQETEVLGLYTKKNDVFFQALKIFEKDSDLYYRIAVNYHYGLSDLNKALEFYRKSYYFSEDKSKYSEYFLKTGDILFEQKEFFEAIKQYTTAVKILKDGGQEALAYKTEQKIDSIYAGLGLIKKSTPPISPQRRAPVVINGGVITQTQQD